ncbi:MAG: preprotein translocase subunit SecE [Brevefilum sp.]
MWVRFLPGLPGIFNAVYQMGGVLDVSKERLVAAKKRKKVTIIQRIQRFWRETIGELRKVTWPTPKEAWKMTRLVMIVMVIMALILGVLDLAFSRLITLLVAL